MKIRFLALTAVVGVSSGWIASCTVEQPAGACKASHSTNYGIFDLVSATADGGCAQLLGDFIYMSKYNPPGTEDTKLAMSVEATAGAFLGDPRITDNNTLSATGDYPFEPTDGFCVAPDMPAITVNVPETPGEPLEDGGPGDPIPAANFSYKFTNVRVVSTPQVPGTQWEADLAYTEDGCTANYKVTGISPLVTCNVELDDGGIGADPSLCEIQDLPDGGRAAAVGPFGESTNPDFDLECDTTVRSCFGDPCMLCRPAGPIPALLND